MQRYGSCRQCTRSSSSSLSRSIQRKGCRRFLQQALGEALEEAKVELRQATPVATRLKKTEEGVERKQQARWLWRRSARQWRSTGTNLVSSSTARWRL
eukprot:720266-Amphidinium_carterae.2